jgi:hypothetical protein
MIRSLGVNKCQHDTTRFRLRVSIVGRDDEQVLAEMIDAARTSSPATSFNRNPQLVIKTHVARTYRPQFAISAGHAVLQCSVP